MDEQEVLDKLVIFNQPPGFWDSLEALGAALIHTEWCLGCCRMRCWAEGQDVVQKQMGL